MSKKDEKPQLTAESHLGPQLGTDTTELALGKYDPRIFSKLHPLDPIWMGYFLNKPKKKGGRFCRTFIGNVLKLKRSEEGWGTNKIIQFTAAAKGTPSVGELMKKPGWLGRNVTDRAWKKKAEEEGSTVVE